MGKITSMEPKIRDFDHDENIGLKSMGKITSMGPEIRDFDYAGIIPALPQCN